MIVLLNVNFLLEILDLLDSDIASLFESIGDFEWVDALIEQLLGLLEESSCQNYYTCGTITDFVVLRLGQLHQ
jgi:hypothetical protein